MLVEIITPDTTLFEGSAKLLQLPGTGGSFELLENHAPIISALKEGKIKVLSADNSEMFIPIRSGVVEVFKNKVIILAEPVRE